ncbi:hypothetical protein GOODEAATRI_017233 [Goodea atripinnis]|uniref:Uncharacterized protein n=1 Tax=Goodea atripinnis TaxID=208336 RepID=A0ABV0PYR5_9TELE
MYGRYTQELGVFAKEEAARLKESGQRRSTSERSRTQDLLEYKGRCAKCHTDLCASVSFPLIFLMSFSVVLLEADESAFHYSTTSCSLQMHTNTIDSID